MKKRVLSMLMVMIMMVSMLSVSVFAAHEGACIDADNDCVCDTEGCSEAVHNWDAGVCTKCAVACTHEWLTSESKAVCDICAMNHSHVLTYVTGDAANHWQVCKDCPVDATKQYNVAPHSDEDGNMACDVCEGHVCSTITKFDASYHWQACANDSCTLIEAVKVAHVWEADEANTTSTNTAYKCACGATKSEHVHVWETTPTWDENHHWYKCTDPACVEINSEGIHWDYNNSGICDFEGCNAAVPGKTFAQLTISGLTEPAEGAAVDFTVDIAEVGYDKPLVTVSWNRITNLSKGTSVALGETTTFAADNMYSVGIVVPVTWNDTVSDNLKVILNGKEVPYYGKEAFAAAQKTYEGDNTVYMAKLDKVNGRQCVVIGVMYAKIGGTHSHNYGSDWVETPAKHYYLCSGCGETKDAAYHYDNNKSGLCDVCGFDMKYFNKNATATNTGSGTGTATHTHTYSTDWVEDISNHWKQCTGCGAKTQTAAHADLNNTGKCDVCGFVMTAAAGHTHTFATEWTETFAQHYKVCSCGAKNEIAAHVDLNNTGKCDTCGYAMTTLSNNGIVADTGDDNATFLWMAAFALSVLGAGTAVLFARKKREE